MKGTSQVLLRWSNPFLSSWRFGDFHADRVAALMLFALMASGPQKAAGLFDSLGCPLCGAFHVGSGATGLGAVFCLTPSQLAFLPAVLVTVCKVRLVELHLCL